ncbi:MAG: hypothetical protein AB1567_02220 [bacterium]
MNVDVKSYKETLEQIWDKVVTVLGPMTTAVILKKVIYKSQDKYYFLNQLKINEEGINFDSLKIKNKEELQQGFESLINNLCDILTNLTGDVLIKQIKGEINKVYGGG